MLIQNAVILDENFQLARKDILVEGDRIVATGTGFSTEGQEVADASGLTAVPGFVDIHIHGCDGEDASNGTVESIRTMARFLLKKGVTSFCPTTMTLPEEQIAQALSCAKYCMENPEEGARVLGVHMEGPYVSMKKKGAQKGDYVRTPDFEQFRRLYDGCGGIVRMVVVAPETEGADDFIRQASKLCTVSIAHTEADYDQAKHSFDMGITHATHLYNAMSGFTHRAPGVVGAVFDDERVTPEIICDGFHIHPAVLRTTFRLLGERITVVSDSMSAAGLADGEYELGGQPVYVRDSKACLKDGTIAGSTTNLYQEMKNLVSWGIPFEQAVRCVSQIPARCIGMDDQVGSIAAGRLADVVLLDKDLNIVKIFQNGKVCG